MSRTDNVVGEDALILEVRDLGPAATHGPTTTTAKMFSAPMHELLHTISSIHLRLATPAMTVLEAAT